MAAARLSARTIDTLPLKGATSDVSRSRNAATALLVGSVPALVSAPSTRVKNDGMSTSGSFCCSAPIVPGETSRLSPAFTTPSTKVTSAVSTIWVTRSGGVAAFVWMVSSEPSARCSRLAINVPTHAVPGLGPVPAGMPAAWVSAPARR